MPHDSDPTSDQPAKAPAHDATTSSHAATAGRKQAADATLPKGSVFGHYTIEDVLGAGGMGVVYRARQERPAREVALKVIRPGFASSQALRRFELEAEVLGRLQHPGIAQVYEAGTAHDQPFFAMELVRGEPLTRFAEARELSTRARLELFARVCDAVQHAHTKGVIHRDLKPGNILVDASGQPKILDFGVARLTQHDVQAVTIQTDIGQLIGTVPYMSPEQVEGDPANLDTRSDVYALGVILFELLTGRLPYDLSKKLIHEAARIIREDEPTRLSSINRTLRGDIETIALKALEKDKGRRYQAASDLGSDITRFLRDEPIVARPASRGYQLRKFAKRNKALVGGVLAVVGALLAGLAGTTAGLIRAEQQRRVAERESVRAEAEASEARRQGQIASAVNEFLNHDLLGRASTDTARDPDIRLRTVLEHAASRVKAGVPGPPEVEAQLRLTIGRVYSQLSLDDEAEEHLARALALLEQTAGPRSLPVAEALHALAYLRAPDRDTGVRVEQGRRALAIRQELLPPGDPLIALTISDLNWIEGWERDWKSLDPYPDRMIAMIAGLRGKGETVAQLRAQSRALLAEIERDAARGDWARAERRIEDEIAPYLAMPPLRQRVPLALAQAASDFGARGLAGVGRAGSAVATRLAVREMAADDPIRAFVLSISIQAGAAYGVTDELRGAMDEAMATVARCLEGKQNIACSCWVGLGASARRLKQLDRAEWLFTSAIAECQTEGVGGTVYRDSIRGLAGTASDRDDHSEAAELSDRLVRMNLFPGRCPASEFIRDLVTLARMRLNAGDPAGAAAEVWCALSDEGRAKSGHPITMREARYILARAAQDQGDPGLAEHIVCDVLEEVRRDGVPMDTYIARYVALASRLAREDRRPEEARSLAEPGLHAVRLALGIDHARTNDLQRELALALIDLRRFGEAAVLLETLWRSVFGRSGREQAQAGAAGSLADLYTSWNAAEPGKGYDVRAAEWRARLEVAGEGRGSP